MAIEAAATAAVAEAEAGATERAPASIGKKPCVGRLTGKDDSSADRLSQRELKIWHPLSLQCHDEARCMANLMASGRRIQADDADGDVGQLVASLLAHLLRPCAAEIIKCSAIYFNYPATRCAQKQIKKLLEIFKFHSAKTT